MNADQPAIEVLFTPADFAALYGRDLSRTLCVVFDVFRATSTIVTALANGAAAVVPVGEISEAMALRQQDVSVLLAGERNGLRILGDRTGGIDFDFGNSPREFTPGKVRGKTIALTTTNGSRALRACAGAAMVLAGSFLNLRATADFLRRHPEHNILLVCSGTGDLAAYEDILGAGALLKLLVLGPSTGSKRTLVDSAYVALQTHALHEKDLMDAVPFSRNGRRLLGIPELKEDVAICLARDTCNLIVTMKDGKLTGSRPPA